MQTDTIEQHGDGVAERRAVAAAFGPPETWPATLRTSLDICFSSRFPMLLWWGDDLTMFYNEAYATILGDKHPRALGAPGREIWAEIWDVIGPMLEQAMAGSATWSEDQLLLVERAGFVEEAYFTFSYSPVPGRDGAIDGVFTAVTETTDRVLRERRLRVLGELSERARDITTAEGGTAASIGVLAGCREDIPFAALYVIDDDHATLDAVSSLDREQLDAELRLDEHAPWSLATAVSRGSALVDVPDWLAGVLDPIEGVVPRHAFVQPLRDPGSALVTSVLVTGLNPHRPWDGEYRDFVGLVADQLARSLADARAERQSRERAEALAELNRAKTEFFSNVSHEFRTPLTLLHQPLGDVLADPALTEEQRDALEVVRRNADRLTKLVNTLLDFSRIEAGRGGGGFRATDLAEVTDELASVFRSAIDSAGLDFDLDINALPQPVHLDRDGFEKIVFNLLSNAIKYTFEGTITVRLRDGGEGAVLEVADTGVGVPPDDLDRLFERFHRVRGSRARSHEGTGIGLSLARELARMHGGDIEVESAEGVGTTFRVTLPYGAGHLPPDQIDPDPTVGRTAIDAATYLEEALGWTEPAMTIADDEVQPDVGETADAHVLIVDDNADLRRYLHRVLGAHWRVSTAVDGTSGLERIRAERPDLVLTDVMMPGMDGFELVAALRDDPELAATPVVMLSARAGEASTVGGLDAGADDYLVKPFTNLELVARIRTNLEMARHREQTAAARVRDEMMAGLSHDMQTPLASILGFLGVVEQAELPEYSEIAGRVRRQGRRLRGLVRQFLDFSRLDGERLPDVHPVPLDPAAAVAEVADLCDAAARVEWRVDPGVPRALGDPDRVEQILLNLCSNALKFSGDRPIRMGASLDGDRVAFTVADEGPGVPADEQEQVFTKFFRGRGHEGVAGTGLGLYIGRGLAEAMGGSLEVESRPGEGATFVLRLPLADDGAN
ncbi:MAG: HAMP domain-containing histidine kinase [Actinobacteria bacterium]|nr:HAMP domain-containing histidine kinase [Actinomycetota bacterium]